MKTLKRSFAGGALAVAMAVTGTVAPALLTPDAAPQAQAQTTSAPRLGFIADRAVIVGQDMPQIRLAISGGHNNKVSWTGMPSWVKYNSATQTFYGKATTQGTWYPTITVTDSYGRKSTQYPAITVAPESARSTQLGSNYDPRTYVDNEPPVISYIPTIIGRVGERIPTTRIQTDDRHATIKVEGLAPGLSVYWDDNIVGTPTKKGFYTGKVTATDLSGNSSTKTIYMYFY